MTLLGINEVEYGLPAVLWVTLSIGVVAAALTLGTVFHAFRAWRHRYWQIAGRIHYTLVTLACLTLVWQLNHWNLLGFHA